jgi:Family of unknown function (DUF6191)
MSFLEIFQPGLKHLREERDRQKMLVVRPSHGGGAPMGIDLDAGKATISIHAAIAVGSQAGDCWWNASNPRPSPRIVATDKRAADNRRVRLLPLPLGINQLLRNHSIASP